MKNNSPQPSRRQILSSAAAASAASLAATSCSMTSASVGADDREIPKAPEKKPIPEGTPIRVGLIGTGGMGGGHLGNMMGQIANGDENFQVVALADVNKAWLGDKVKTATERQPGVTVDSYTNYEDLVSREDIDCVLIASPEHWHAQMAIDCIATGKDVYVEKPMTYTLEEAFWMHRTMDANPHMRLQVGTQFMMQEKYKAAKRLIAEGAIGYPTLSQTSYCRNTPNGEWNYYGIDKRVKPGETLDWEAWCGSRGAHDWDPKLYHRWRRYKDFSTGVIGDLLVHVMTPMMYAIDRGWPVKVQAAGGHYIDKDMENQDQVFLTVEFEKDHTMIVAGATNNSTGLETMIRGNEANLYLNGTHCEMRPERPYAEDIEPQTIECAAIADQPSLRLDWLNAVRTREENISQVTLGTQVMVVVDLASRALWQGGSWTFDPQTRAVTRV